MRLLKGLNLLNNPLKIKILIGNLKKREKMKNYILFAKQQVQRT